jgi:HK97 family phage prohead protease|nr:MAG TPA: major capsid protein [Caudoviricetes sp.]
MNLLSRKQKKRSEIIKMAFRYDFSGYATRNDIKCTDGRIIRAGAFADQDGAKVPLVWNHDHRGMENVIGHALLENRSDGVYAYGVFNETKNGINAKELVEHGDICAMSIYANKLKQNGPDVTHGVIRELSLVYAGANPGAYIDSVITHEDGADEEAVIYFDQAIDASNGELTHEDKETQEKDSKEEPEKKPDETPKKTPKEIIDGLSEKKKKVAVLIIRMSPKIDEIDTINDSKEQPVSDKGETVADIWETFTDEEKKAVYAVIGTAKENNESSDDGDEKEDNDNKEEKVMRHNAFDKETQTETVDGVLTHSDQEAILALAKSKSCGSLREAIERYAEETDHLQHGIDEIETLFPEYKDVKPGAPELVTDNLGWVTTVMNGVHKSPISRIRTRQTDARGRKIRGLGYQKGGLKKEVGNVKLMSRTTDPYTVFVKDSMNRDDITDITDFDVVSYEYNLLRMALNEEIATAIMVGDGREDGDEDKIPEDKIRPIWTDDELFTVHKAVDVAGMKTKLQGSDTSKNFGDNYIETEAIIEAALDARIDYRGSGSPAFFCTPQLVNTMLMARDLNGRRIYNSIDELKTILNVSAIVTIEQFAGLQRTVDTNKMALLGIMVNLDDYYVGATKGGQITQFNQFDIDFNKEKYLIETRISGALTKIKSAIVLEKKAS